MSIFENVNILQQQKIHFSLRICWPSNFFNFLLHGCFLSSWQNVKGFFFLSICTHQGTGKDSCMKVTISRVQYMFSRKVLLEVFSAVQCCSMHVYNSDVFYVSKQKHVSSQPRSSHISTGKNLQIAVNY